MKSVTVESWIADLALIGTKHFLLRIRIFRHVDLATYFYQPVDGFQLLVSATLTTGFPTCVIELLRKALG